MRFHHVIYFMKVYFHRVYLGKHFDYQSELCIFFSPLLAITAATACCQSYIYIYGVWVSFLHIAVPFDRTFFCSVRLAWKNIFGWCFCFVCSDSYWWCCACWLNCLTECHHHHCQQQKWYFFLKNGFLWILCAVESHVIHKKRAHKNNETQHNGYMESKKVKLYIIYIMVCVCARIPSSTLHRQINV